MKKLYLPIVTSALLLAFSACGGQKSKDTVRESVELTGAGATFPLPFYNMSFENYSATNGDRIAYGGVTDFIELRFVRFAVFNLADVAICLGAVIAAVALLIDERRKESAHV